MNLENRLNYLSHLAELDRFMNMIGFEKQEISSIVDSLLNQSLGFIDIDEIKNTYLKKKLDVLSRIASHQITMENEGFPKSMIISETEALLDMGFDPKMFNIGKKSSK